MKKIIWVERLGAADLTMLFIETLFSRAFVRYDENRVSGSAGRFLRALQERGVCKNFHAAKLSLQKKDAEGFAANYSMENDMDNCITAFCSTYLGGESDRFKNAARLYIASCLTYRATFVTMVEAEPDFRDRTVSNTLYIKRHPLNSIIIDYYRAKGYRVRESLSMYEHLMQCIKPCYRICMFALAKLSTAKVRTNISTPRDSVWVEYCHGSMPEFLFWRRSLDEKRFDIVCYLDRNDNAPLNEQVAAIEKDGFKWVDLHFLPLVKLAGIGARELADMCRAFFSTRSRIPLWLRAFKSDYRMWVLLYRPVFRRFKVRVLIQHQASLWIQEPQLEALEAEEGIMVGFQRASLLYYKYAFWSIPQHVFFVWGKMIYECIEKRGNVCRHVLPSGLCVVQKKGDRMTDGLKDGLKFIIAIFDSSVAYNIYQGEESLGEFYIRTMEMIEKNSDWGGIVKSKNMSISDIGRLPRGREIVDKMKKLMDQKRLVYPDASNSPLAASSRANLSVCYSLNSAGVIAGACGFRAVHWDCSGWLNNPFYKDRGQRFVFHTLDEVEKAVIEASKGDTSIGDFSGWKDRLNHFNDDKAHERIGQFIQDFMSDVAVTGNAGSSLTNAVRRYNSVNKVDQCFLKQENLWETEKCGVVGGVR